MSININENTLKPNHPTEPYETVTPDKLEEHFKSHGTILGAVVQRGFGFIQFEEDKCAQLAIQNEHGVMFQGRKLNVKQAIDNKSKNVQSAEDSANSGPGPIQKPNDGPPRKMRRGGGVGGRGGGRGPMVMDRERVMSPATDERDYRDGPAYYGRDDNYPITGAYHPPPTNTAPVPDRVSAPTERNDCEIIVVSKTLTEYAEYIEHRLKSIGLTVDLLFPNEDVPIGRVLANISSRGCLYAVLVMPQNEEHRSLTLNILHGIPQEHRNMPIDDAVALIARNFETYMRGEKNAPTSASIASAALATERHPEAVQILLNLLADNRQLTTLQFDRIIKYLQEKREHQYKHEMGDAGDTEQDKSKQVELQHRIMNILNKTGVTPNVSAPVVAPPTPKTPILNDPSVQKALDSLLQGDLLKSIASSGRF
ncbi:Neosin [Carabus blaptoides fortunei]